MSNPDSPSSYGSPSDAFSDVPTEPLPPSDRQLVHEYMSRRQHFLCDYERYNPVQNMQMLANHVFDLSENIHDFRNDFTGSRRILSIVSDNQRIVSDSIKEVGSDLGNLENEVKHDVGGLRQDLNNLKNEIQNIRHETQMGIQELKNMLTIMMSVRA